MVAASWERLPGEDMMGRGKVGIAATKVSQKNVFLLHISHRLERRGLLADRRESDNILWEEVAQLQSAAGSLQDFVSFVPRITSHF